MKILLLALLLTALSCTNAKQRQEYGSLEGNVYWKYNNYVGSKPDAGSKVDLYSIIDSTITYSATADVRGDFTIDSVPVGGYLLIVRSENTRDNAANLFTDLWIHSAIISKVFGVETKQYFNSESKEKIDSFTILSSKSLNDRNPSRALRHYQAYKDSAINIAADIFKKIPIEFSSKTNLMLITYPPKIDFKLVTIEPKRKQSVVIDFGTTYL